MSQSSKFKELNGDGGSNANHANNKTNKNAMNGSAMVVENGNDLNTRKAALTPLEFRVTQQRETERPYSNKYNKFWETGTYHCVVCDEELFKSETKFESKSGWPAFYNVVDPRRVKLTPDLSHVGANLLLLVAKPDLARTEVSCANCNAHLGHLFKDGPKPTGLRYCINSASLKFKSEDGTVTLNNAMTPTTVNGNGSLENGKPLSITEYICNPDNTCSRPASAVTSPVSPSTGLSNGKEFRPRTARENFFSSLETGCCNNTSNNYGLGTPTTPTSLPPMGALCLNNQSCQRIVTPKKTSSTSIIISNGAENNLNSKAANTTNNTNNSIKTSSGSNSNTNLGSYQNGTRGTENNIIMSGATTHKANNTATTFTKINSNFVNPKPAYDTINTSTTLTTPVSSINKSSLKQPFSKGASLTAARINFFQKMASKEQDQDPPPSRWAATFNSTRWSSSSPSTSSNNQFSTSFSTSNKNTHDNHQNRIISNYSSQYNTGVTSGPGSCPFPSSCSSGSLSAVLRQQPNYPNNDEFIPPLQPRRSTSSFFTNSSSSSFSSAVGVSASASPIEQVSTPPRPVAVVATLRETTL